MMSAMATSTQRTEMSNEPAPMPEEDAREAINRWSQGFFRVRYLGDKIFLDKIAPCYSYKLQLRTQYEDRSVSPVSVPYHGQPLDDIGTPPAVWDIAVRRPDDFDERTETLAVPHTDRVGLCPKCAGVGRIDCSKCHTTGQVTCPHCGGRGYQELHVARHEPQASGTSTTRTEVVRNDCPHCASGFVTCTSCSGNRRVTCPSCEGTGQVRTFDELTVHFRNTTQTKALDTTDLPDDLLSEPSGEQIFFERQARIEGCPGMPSAVTESGQSMLRESHRVDERATRLLFQELTAARVPIHEVHYRYAGVSRRLWIYGDSQVHAPGAPWRRDRLWKLLAAIVGGIALVALLIFLFR
jgi:hypothetical protein